MGNFGLGDNVSFLDGFESVNLEGVMFVDLYDFIEIIFVNDFEKFKVVNCKNLFLW